ncbi:uncharacterized protein LOC110442746 isoform X2 [Mizuhopecten yessoensis]|uniref:Deoxynucleotidyltransferase terminal-interacting protein 1 n=1 Tax=Mizuhopecten yessoensis TaxID=6573 RepID=A0A210PGK8_MIZYE|nr:uncharacterized protein LOC110442746 isoform X2 [Mizuhopecten yessoensis]OWF35610.1 Deoxynucleotidyltransferase terminal-interacting protein 1 [Mizuhopecten yessoensis]
MEDEKKTKPVKEKKKRSQGPKKEKKPKEPQQRMQSGTGGASSFFSQSQQLHQQEGIVLGDSHSSTVGRLAAQHFSSSNQLPFTTLQHGVPLSSAPSQASLRVPSHLPPKKSMSPSRMASLTEPQGIPAGFQSHGPVPTTASDLAAHLTSQPPTVNIGRSEGQEQEQGGLLRQQLMQQRMTLPTELLSQPERKFSPYQQSQSVSLGVGDRGKDSHSPQTGPNKHQREDIGRTKAPPNVQLPTFGSKTETGRILGGHHSRALGLEEKVHFPPQFDSSPGPGKIQLQRIVIPTTREDVRRTVSPAKRESQPQPAHLGEHTAYQVSTIQRTPSPAHERRSPAPPFGRSQEQAEKTQPVNLSLHIPELHKKHGSGGHASIAGSVLSSLYAIQAQAKSGSPGHVVYHPARTEQQDYTIKAPELNFSKVSRGEGGSISIPSQILNTVQTGGQLQKEILRQTLLQGVSNAQMHSMNQATYSVQHGSRVTKEEAKSHDQRPIMYKFEADGSRKTVSPTPHSQGSAKRGPSPHQHPHPSLSGNIELKRASPAPGTTSNLMSVSQFSSSTVSQQPIRYIIPSSVSPKMSTVGSHEGPPTEVLRHKVPSPKPQHRHKEQLAALHQTYAAKGTSGQSSTQLSGHVPQTSSVHSSNVSSVQSMLPSTVPTSISFPYNAGQIRQPVVSLVRLPDNHPKYEEKRSPPPPYSVIQIPQDSGARFDIHKSEKTSFTDVFGAVKKPEQHQRPTIQHPKQVNPFTFPAKAQAKLFPYHHLTMENKDDLPGGKQKRITPFPKEPLIADAADDMPKLLPVSPVNSHENEEGRRKEDKDINIEELTPIPNPFNMRLQNLANLPTTSIYRSSYRAHSVAVQRAKSGCIVSPAKSLDLLRQNLQRFINKEIDVIIQQYVEKFFKPGIDNIKENSGSAAVGEEHIQAVCRQMLEEAKKMYLTDQGRCSVTPTRDIPDNVSENGSTGSRSRVPFGRKRKPSDTDSEKSHAPRRKKGRPPLVSGRSTPSKLKNNDAVKREGPKWDQERININTLFIMGARANKALGLGATRGRIYIKHPDLFKFSGDQDDKQWLYENHHMPATGGKAYMLLLEDVKELAKDDEYRDNGNQMPQELIGFTIPEWMLEKVKMQMMAGRTDNARKAGRSRSTTPNQIPTSVIQDEDDDMKHLPFSSFSSRKIKDEIQTSPSGDTEMEFLSGVDNDDQAFTRMSPFTLTGGFDEPSPSPSDLEDETPLSAPFDLTN